MTCHDTPRFLTYEWSAIQGSYLHSGAMHLLLQTLGSFNIPSSRLARLVWTQVALLDMRGYNELSGWFVLVVRSWCMFEIAADDVTTNILIGWTLYKLGGPIYVMVGRQAASAIIAAEPHVTPPAPRPWTSGGLWPMYPQKFFALAYDVPRWPGLAGFFARLWKGRPSTHKYEVHHQIRANINMLDTDNRKF